MRNINHCSSVALGTLALSISSIATAHADDLTTFPTPSGIVLSAQPAPSDAKQDPAAPSSGIAHPFAIRLGVSIARGVGGAGGLDYTPNVTLIPGLITRITGEGITTARADGSISDIVPFGAITLDQIYQYKPASGMRPYVGAGLGVYTGSLGKLTGSGFFGNTYQDITTIGGKVFTGVDLTSTTSLEAALHFAGPRTLVTLQLRLKL